MRSPALRRGSTRAIPFDRSHAFAPHPCRACPSRLHPSRSWRAARLRYPTLAAAGAALMSEKDTPYRLLQTDHFTSTHRIGGFSSASGVLFRAAFSHILPRGPKSVGEPSSRNALDGARQASVIVTLRFSPALRQIGSRARCRPGSPRGFHVLFGPCCELSLVSLIWPFVSVPVASVSLSGTEVR